MSHYLLYIDLLGIIALFLYAMHLLTTGLSQISHARLTHLLKTHTSTILQSIIAGLILATLTQSSTATTAIAISLLASNLITLKSGVAIVMGANIGTCFSTIFLSFDLQNYAFLIILIGTFIFFAFKKNILKQIGQIILASGILFLSLQLLEGKILTLFDQNFFDIYILKNPNNLFMGLVIGTIISGIIQSSSATIVIAQTLCNNGLISLPLSIAIMLGANIGTCFTALFISLFNSNDVKVLAISQFWLNIIGAFGFLPLINIYVNSAFITNNQPLNISIAHFIFNLLSTIIGYMLIDKLISFSSIWIFKKEKRS